MHYCMYVSEPHALLHVCFRASFWGETWQIMCVCVCWLVGWLTRDVVGVGWCVCVCVGWLVG
jgi:hypothetical protein